MANEDYDDNDAPAPDELDKLDEFDQLWDKGSEAYEDEDFTGDQGGDEPPNDQQQPQGDQGAGNPAANASPPDPYEALPDDAKAYVDDIRSQLRRRDYDVKAMAGRVGEMERMVNQMRGDPLKDVTSKIKDPEKWDKIAKAYPDFADAVKEMVTARTKAYAEFLHNKLGEHIAPLERSAVETKVGQSMRQLLEIEPDADVVRRTPEFLRFLNDSPPGIQQLANSWDPRDAAFVVQTFKQQTGWVPPQTGNGQRSATAAPSRVVRRNPNAATELPSSGRNGRRSQPGKQGATYDDYWDEFAKNYS